MMAIGASGCALEDEGVDCAGNAPLIPSNLRFRLSKAANRPVAIFSSCSAESSIGKAKTNAESNLQSVGRSMPLSQTPYLLLLGFACETNWRLGSKGATLGQTMEGIGN